MNNPRTWFRGPPQPVALVTVICPCAVCGERIARDVPQPPDTRALQCLSCEQPEIFAHLRITHTPGRTPAA